MRKHFASSLICIAAFVFLSLPASAQTHGAQVSGAIEHDVSFPLANMPPLQPKGGPRTKPVLPLHPDQTAATQSDPVVQTSTGSLAATTSGLGFAGVGKGDYGFTPNRAARHQRRRRRHPIRAVGQ